MIHLGDCVAVMATLEPDSIDAIVTDPPYGLGFMGTTWDDAGRVASVPPSVASRIASGVDVGRLGNYPGGKGSAAVVFRGPEYQAWCEGWAREARRVAKPGAHLLAFGGTRTYHRLAAAIEDAGWEIRDCLVWAYSSGFPKSRYFSDGWGTALKPAWEPIVMARKPFVGTVVANREQHGTGALNIDGTRMLERRWPANVILSAEVFEPNTPGVVVEGSSQSRFFVLPKAPRTDREPVLGSHRNVHPTVKPTDLMRHLVRLVTPPGGTVLDPFLGSGSTALAAEMEGFPWLGIEREAEYVAIAEARLNGTQRGFGLSA